ncbi:MAG TPA: efflux RND transporter periplasmic adaptor subunit [Thermoanaerobaculia bacterium]|nr:efflux RND transporter periplasmic adaptor subunit [Thermoanaerobaculia bacterium]
MKNTVRFAGAVLVALASGCARAAKTPPPELVPVKVGTVVQKPVPVQLRNVGSVIPYNTVAVRALVNGEILQVHFHEGQDVHRGDLLFQIDPRPYEAALAQAQGALARDRAQLENAQADVKRYADLVQKDYVTAQQYDAVRANAAAFAATVRADEAAVEKARLDVGYCAIRSPLEGRTGVVMVQAGNVVKANDAVLVTINQVEPVYVSVALPERELAEIRRRQAGGPLAVEAEEPSTGRLLARGELTFIDNTVDRTTGTITVKATFRNQDRVLWPGEFVNARITLATLPNAIVAPQGAVQNGQQGLYAYVLKADNTVEARPVTVGRTLSDGSVIDQGLSAGERVVTDGQLRLRPGAKVEVLPSETAAAEKRS